MREAGFPQDLQGCALVADLCEAWACALLGRPVYAPGWVADSPAASMRGPAWPSFLTVRDQVRLARGEHARRPGADRWAVSPVHGARRHVQ